MAQAMRRYHARRDATTDAESAEAHAERVDTSDAWLVAADAWELAGQPERARFAILRQAKYNPNVITNDEAADIRQRMDAWNAQWRGRRSLSAAEQEQIKRRLGFDRPSNEEIGELELYSFLRDPPTHLLTYPRDDGHIITFGGQILGRITHRGRSSRVFGRGPRLEHVTVRAINGYWYSGTCNRETGDYCKLKRGKAWLKR